MAVVLVFFICWTPFHAQRLMFVIVTLNGTWTQTNGSAHHVLFLASGELQGYKSDWKKVTFSSSLGVGYYLSSCVNPLLYSVMSKRFRRAFRDMFKRSFGGTSNPAPPVTSTGGGLNTGVNHPDHCHHRGKPVTQYRTHFYGQKFSVLFR